MTEPLTDRQRAAIKQWLTALSSGLYPKGQGALIRTYPDGNREYCCLGVLGLLQGMHASPDGQALIDHDHNSWAGIPSDEVLAHVGLLYDGADEDDPDYNVSEIINLNDNDAAWTKRVIPYLRARLTRP